MCSPNGRLRQNVLVRLGDGHHRDFVLAHTVLCPCVGEIAVSVSFVVMPNLLFLPGTIVKSYKPAHPVNKR